MISRPCVYAAGVKKKKKTPGRREIGSIKTTVALLNLFTTFVVTEEVYFLKLFIGKQQSGAVIVCSFLNSSHDSNHNSDHNNRHPKDAAEVLGGHENDACSNIYCNSY